MEIEVASYPEDHDYQCLLYRRFVCHQAREIPVLALSLDVN